jgi:hypothetical protein
MANATVAAGVAGSSYAPRIFCKVVVGVTPSVRPGRLSDGVEILMRNFEARASSFSCAANERNVFHDLSRACLGRIYDRFRN